MSALVETPIIDSLDNLKNINSLMEEDNENDFHQESEHHGNLAVDENLENQMTEEENKVVEVLKEESLGNISLLSTIDSREGDCQLAEIINSVEEIDKANDCDAETLLSVTEDYSGVVEGDSDSNIGHLPEPSENCQEEDREDSSVRMTEEATQENVTAETNNDKEDEAKKIAEEEAGAKAEEEKRRLEEEKRLSFEEMKRKAEEEAAQETYDSYDVIGEFVDKDNQELARQKREREAAAAASCYNLTSPSPTPTTSTFPMDNSLMPGKERTELGKELWDAASQGKYRGKMK